MNETSSRSHAVFTIVVTQKSEDTAYGTISEKVSLLPIIKCVFRFVCKLAC
ncbi:unnamed protein product [Trichobilharzia regenti]|nr:unnamed protein product [Trichobilharzia regenti]